MYYAVISRPKIDTSKIEKVRKEYDPTFGVVGPHVTLVFPVPDSEISKDDFRKHVEAVARTTKMFTATLDKLALSWDQWLFLEPEEGHGREEYDALHDLLYRGPLQKFLRADIPFAPHLAVGQFVPEGSDYSLKDPKNVPLDNKKYEAAKQRIEELGGLAYTFDVAELEIIAISDDFTKTETLARIPLHS